MYNTWNLLWKLKITIPSTRTCLFIITLNKLEFIAFNRIQLFSHLSGAINWLRVIYLWPFSYINNPSDMIVLFARCERHMGLPAASPVCGLSGHGALNLSFSPSSPLFLVLTSSSPHLQRRRGETRRRERRSRTHSFPKPMTTPRRCPRQCQL